MAWKCPSLTSCGAQRSPFLLLCSGTSQALLVADLWSYFPFFLFPEHLRKLKQSHKFDSFPVAFKCQTHIYVKTSVCCRLDLPVAETATKILPSQLQDQPPGTPRFLAEVTVNSQSSPWRSAFSSACFREFLLDLIAHANLFILILLRSPKNWLR